LTDDISCLPDPVRESMLLTRLKKLAFLFTDMGRKVFCITYNNTEIFDTDTPLYSFMHYFYILTLHSTKFVLQRYAVQSMIIHVVHIYPLVRSSVRMTSRFF